MAYEVPGFQYTLVASVDLSSSQYRAVNVDANGQAALPAAGGDIVGVVQNKPKANEAATVMENGITQMEAGGAVTAGDNVTVDNTGRVVTAATGDTIIGRAFETASGAGIYIAVLLRNAGRASA